MSENGCCGIIFIKTFGIDVFFIYLQCGVGIADAEIKNKKNSMRTDLKLIKIRFYMDCN